MTDPLLAQYAVLSERGMHFGRLFWQSIAFHFVMLLGAAAVFRDLQGSALGDALILAGLATLLMAFVAWRVWVTEKKYEALLTAIEDTLKSQGATAIQSSPPSDRRGARFAVSVSVGILGAVLIAFGFSALMVQAG